MYVKHRMQSDPTVAKDPVAKHIQTTTQKNEIQTTGQLPVMQSRSIHEGAESFVHGKSINLKKKSAYVCLVSKRGDSPHSYKLCVS